MSAGVMGSLFGMLILVAGGLVLFNMWAIIHTRAALDAAARDYLRTYTEQSCRPYHPLATLVIVRLGPCSTSADPAAVAAHRTT